MIWKKTKKKGLPIAHNAVPETAMTSTRRTQRKQQKKRLLPSFFKVYTTEKEEKKVSFQFNMTVKG